MFSFWTCLVILILPGLQVLAHEAALDYFSFDVSPLSIRECSGRPPNNCGPLRVRESDCAFLVSRHGPNPLLREFDKNADNTTFKMKGGRSPQTHITLHCDYAHSENVKKENLAPQVRAIRTWSPRRAVEFDLRDDALLDPEVLAPVSHQIVEFSLMFCANTTITSRLPLLNFTNLMDFTLQECRVSITVRKTDFSHLHKIRVIKFHDIRFDSIEPGTFTDLPDLITLLIKAYGFTFTDDDVKDKALQRLQCDAQFDWLWSWLDNHPGLQRERQLGEVYTIGSLESNEAYGMLTRNCMMFRTTKMTRSIAANISVELFD